LNFQEEDNFCTTNATAEFTSLCSEVYCILKYAHCILIQNMTLDSQESLETARATWRRSQDWL